MQRPFLAAALALLASAPLHAATPAELARWRGEAARVTITRDDWGIAHVHGKSDADAVFGMVFAQAEDDYNRVETNYLTALGRMAEAEGESRLWQDLRQRLFIDPDALKADYARSPGWLRAIMDGWADGLNWFLATHREVKSRVIEHWEPWMALAFTEGSIGGDIERVDLGALQAFYERHEAQAPDRTAALEFHEPSGSNGYALGPSRVAGGGTMLFINPHTSFFFRAELQVTSDQGLNAYGAATWGQPFIYQGFNEHLGFMHTSSGVDSVDEFLETVDETGGRLRYRYGREERPVASRTVTLAYRTPDGGRATRSFTVYSTHHGPITRADGDRWVAMALLNNPVAALEQSFGRTKARSFAEFVKVAGLQANSSNNTIYADADGTIAYLHPQFVPKRNDRFDYTKPVDGADPATDWQGLTPVADLPKVLNPRTGWLYNSNDWPWAAAGPDSPKREAFPRYMDMAGPNPRGPHVEEVLSALHGATLQSFTAAAFDPNLPFFGRVLPPLFAAFDALPAADPQRTRLAGPIALLKSWDRRWGNESTGTSLAVFWAEAMWNTGAKQADAAGISPWAWMEGRATAAERVAALSAAVDRLTRDFGGWSVPWGEINRYQRITGDIDVIHNDAKPSIPVPFASAQWGSLASFGAKSYGTRRLYGNHGNSFVAAVEFGPRIHARAVTAGGESGDPSSPHFNDQANRYATGQLRDVYFYPDELKTHTERTYRPGE